MVIGNGMIARRFSSYKEDNGIVIFASGVSNSKDTDQDNFLREFELLKKTIEQYPDKILVYFSTCSVEDSDLAASPYVVHKRNIEEYIRNNVARFYLFRISNLGGTSNNPYTLLNYFIFNILANQPLKVWRNAYRNIIDIDDMYAVADYFLKTGTHMNSLINIANPKNYPVPFIVKSIEQHLNRRAIFTEVDRGENYPIDISIAKPVFQKLNIHFGDDYIASILHKYYHSK
ncbi:MAG TPA: hypothetical protein VG847_11970 [Chitinophagaceae bacterium]|nr:hypothetical protein [Chitinophagaceae bacterium]